MTEWTKEMMDAEVIECARYGDEDDLRALLTDGADVNSTDEGGSTAMHMAAANGHVVCLGILKQFGAQYKQNNGGNFPIHWAVQNAQLKAFQFLCDNYDVDVLAKNAAGRSTLTEAFTRGEASVLELCLSHPSSSEEKLMSTTSGQATVKLDLEEQEDEEEDISEIRKDTNRTIGETVFDKSLPSGADGAASAVNSGSNELTYDIANSITHCMHLLNTLDGSDKPLYVRELPITRADNPFGSEVAPQDDTTGLGLWPATVLCAKWIVQEENLALIRDKVVVELGAGCGLPGLAAAFYGRARSVYITDIHEPTLQNAIYNVHLNVEDSVISTEGGASKLSTPLAPHGAIGGHSEVTAVTVLNASWIDPSSFPPEKADVILGSDLVYDRAILKILGPAVYDMLTPGGTFLYVAPNEFRDGMSDLVESMASLNLTCTSAVPCPEHYYANPLLQPSRRAAAVGAEKVGDKDDDFVLLFYDLARKQPHTLYTFVKA